MRDVGLGGLGWPGEHRRDRGGRDALDLRGRRASRKVNRVRHLAMLMVRLGCGMTFPAIGTVFGGRDHSTVLSACQRATETTGAEEMRKLRVLVGLDGETAGVRAA